MDFSKAQPPRPPRVSPTSSSSGSGSTTSRTSLADDDTDTDLVNNPFKDLYDYIALDNGNPSLLFGSDVASLLGLSNDTFLELNASLLGASGGAGGVGAGGGLAAANGTAFSLLANATVGGAVSIAAVAAAIATLNGTTTSPALAASGGASSSSSDVQAKGYQNTGNDSGSILEDDFSDVIITTVTSIILGLMILITVIGKGEKGVLCFMFTTAHSMIYVSSP